MKRTKFNKIQARFAMWTRKAIGKADIVAIVLSPMRTKAGRAVWAVQAVNIISPSQGSQRVTVAMFGGEYFEMAYRAAHALAKAIGSTVGPIQQRHYDDMMRPIV